MEVNDPWLAKLVRCAGAGENVVDTFDFSRAVETESAARNGTHLSEEKIQALAEIICRAGDEASAALFVLMATLEDAAHPRAVANTAKCSAFSRCGELNLCGMVDAQVAVLERRLFAGKTLVP
jgi:hypothetical protein